MTKLYQFEIKSIYDHLLNLGFRSRYWDAELEHPYPFDKNIMIVFNPMECQMYLDSEDGWEVGNDLAFINGWINIYSKEHVDLILEKVLPTKYRIANN